MKKLITNVFLLTCIVVVLSLIPLFLSHNSPIGVNIPQLSAEELAAKKAAALEVEQEALRKARVQRVYSCKMDADCIIVDRDPCGCTIGPKGVVAINVKYITDFNALNSGKMITKTCPAKMSTSKECSPSARGVCRAHTCKIAY